VACREQVWVVKLEMHR